MRLQNIQDVKKDISYGAKSYGQLPEKYVETMNSIVKSYIQETNKFMKAYNDEFINIQNTLQNAEEKQKYYLFKIQELMVMKNVCVLLQKPKNLYEELDEEINSYKQKIITYEKVISKCDKEFEECKIRRDREFKELFEIKQEQSLAVVQKQNFILKLFLKLKNKFQGYKNFSRFVLQKYFNKINQMKTETIDNYIKNVKENMVNFSSEINEIIENI